MLEYVEFGKLWEEHCHKIPNICLNQRAYFQKVTHLFHKYFLQVEMCKALYQELGKQGKF